MDRIEFFQMAMEDARARNSSIVELIRFTDQQAMSLAGFFATIGIAAATGAVASLSLDAPYSYCSCAALVSAFVMCMAGAAFAFKVQSTTEIALPGREAIFWKWAVEDDCDPARVVKEYLEALKTSSEKNDQVNKAGTDLMSRARLCAFAAPIASVIGAGAAYIVYKLMAC